MKNFELEQMGVQEMDVLEIKKIDGGEILPYSNSGSNNPLVYGIEGIYNFGAGAVNLFAWSVEQWW